MPIFRKNLGMDFILVFTILVIFFSALIRSTFGFGDAMIAMPLLALFMDLDIATPLLGLCAITYSSLILYKEWRRVKIKDVIVLIITAFIGIPIGIYFLKGNYDSILKIILGSIIVLFSLFNLFKPKLFFLKNDKPAFIFGFISGILGGAYNTNGFPIVVYSAFRRWDPQTFRATMQGYFLPTGFMISIGHFVSGLWTQKVIMSYIYVLPVILIAIFLGSLLNKKIKKEKFGAYIFIILFFAGALLVLKNIPL